jgi:hypothetical protein
VSPEITKDEDDNDTEKLIREHQLKRPRKFFRNTDDDNKTDELGEDVIFVILPTSSRTARPHRHSPLHPPHIPMKLTDSVVRSPTSTMINCFFFISKVLY